LCERVGADVHSVRHGVGSDVRIGTKFLYSGPGYGGSCFPKDVSVSCNSTYAYPTQIDVRVVKYSLQALVHTGREHDVELELAVSTDRVNQRQKGILVRKLR
jgi:UDPglucose 6-dehydrogenase